MRLVSSPIEPWPPNSPPQRSCDRNSSAAPKARSAQWHDSNSGPSPSQGWEEAHPAGDLSSSESCDGWGSGHFSPGMGGCELSVIFVPQKRVVSTASTYSILSSYIMLYQLSTAAVLTNKALLTATESLHQRTFVWRRELNNFRVFHIYIA